MFVTFLLLSLALLCISHALKVHSPNCIRNNQIVGACLLASGLLGLTPTAAIASDLPSLEKCFNAVEKEIDPVKGENIIRLREDVASGDWSDVKAWSREYEAGFRGGVLKSAWKQLKGDEQKRGIEVTNSFTFDLIALNKAARVEDTADANLRIDQIKGDLVEFLKLRPGI